VLVANRFGWPVKLVNIVLDLAAAWLVVCFAAALIPNALASRIVAIIAWTVAALSILGLLSPIIDTLAAASFSLGAARMSLLTLLEAVGTAVILIWGSVVIARIVEHRMSRVATLSPSFQVLFAKLFKFCLVSLAIMLSLGVFGIDLTAFAVFTGALGVGLGFGLQKSVSNLFAGVILLIDKSIKPGDIIEIGGTFGWVMAVRARYVEVETRDGTEFLIPNEDIVTQKVFNWTHQDDNVRLKLPVRVAYDADVRKALALMSEAAGRSPRVLKEPSPSPRVIAFGENGVELELRFWIADVRNGVHNVSSEVLIELLDLFNEHAVRVPLPQRDLYIHKSPQAAAAKLL
jgi:small-conductance mechanosensitive channel